MFVPCVASCITVILLEMLKLLSILQLVGEVWVVMLSSPVKDNAPCVIQNQNAVYVLMSIWDQQVLSS